MFQKHGKRQELEGGINEEAMLLASFIRSKRILKPRTVPLPNFVIIRIFEAKEMSQSAFQPLFPKQYY